MDLSLSTLSTSTSGPSSLHGCSEKPRSECIVCYSDVGMMKSSFCSDEKHSSVLCSECTGNYFNSKLSGGFMGYCPIISCPANHSDGKSRIWAYKKWKAAEGIDPEHAKKFDQYASSLLLFLCSNCHTSKTLLASYATREIESEARAKIQSASISDFAYFDILSGLEEYEAGSIDVNFLYEKLAHGICQFESASDSSIWKVMTFILSLIEDPERRASLQLRHYRSRPRMWTKCCNKEHCWRCKTKDFHDSKSCEENAASLDNSIVPCPTCGVFLAKGDGCNSVTCVCGHQFSWSQQKEFVEKSSQFMSYFPENTHMACANVLTGSQEYVSERIQSSAYHDLAKSWQSTHRVDVNRSLLQWWEGKTFPCPSQSCVSLPSELQVLQRMNPTLNGIKQAMDLYTGNHREEINRLLLQHNTAKASLFLTMYREDERPCAALRLSSSREESPLIASAKLWASENKKLISLAKEAEEARSAKQFLYLFGHLSPAQTQPERSEYTTASEYSTDISDGSLVFTDENRSARRPGGASCFPAAFVRLPSIEGPSRVIFEIKSCVQSVNYLSFGLAKLGRMQRNSSDGFGRTNGSWGVRDDRNESSRDEAYVSENGTSVGRCRKFQLGDVITLTADLREGWFNYDLNGGEFSHRFTVPSENDSPEDYAFGVTFANDHEVSVLPADDSPTTCATYQPAFESKPEISMDSSYSPFRSRVVHINRSQSVMMNSLVKQLRSMFSENPKLRKDFTANAVALGDIQKGVEASCLSFQPIEIFMDSWIAGKQSFLSAFQSSVATSLIPQMSWTSLFDAICWYRANRQAYSEYCELLWATEHEMEHRESAAMMSAVLLNSIKLSNSSSPHSRAQRSAVAYAKLFKSELQEWYQYNDTLEDPIVPKAVVGCTCTQRHIDEKSCSKAKKEMKKAAKREAKLRKRELQATANPISPP